MFENALMYCESQAWDQLDELSKQRLAEKSVIVTTQADEVLHYLGTGQIYLVFFLLKECTSSSLCLVADACEILLPFYENVVVICDDPVFSAQQLMLEWDIREIWHRSHLVDNLFRYIESYQVQVGPTGDTDRMLFELCQAIQALQMNEVLKHLAVVKPLTSTDYRASYVSGCCYQFLGKVEEAAALFEQSLAQNKRFIHSKKSLATCKLILGKHEEAQSIITDLLGINPQSSEILSLQAHLHADKGDWEAAYNCITTARQSYAASTHALEVEIRIDLHQVQLEAALEKLSTIHMLSDYFFMKINEVAVNISRSGDFDQAIEIYHLAYEKAPRASKFKISFNLALAYKRKGMLEESLALLDRTEKECPFKPFDKVVKQREQILQEMAKK